MSSSMIHLATARVYCPQADTLFFIGNIAPDCIDIKDIKDHTHFRDRNDRIEALGEMKAKLDINNPFYLGILLHLYLDLKWDSVIWKGSDFKSDFFDNGKFLFMYYRKQITLASEYLFHKYEWSENLWRNIDEMPQEAYSGNRDFPPDDIKAYIIRNRKWHREHSPETPGIFSIDFIEGFIKNTAEEFDKFIKS